jgi:mono/diheme cytochrome c family protein
MNWMHLPLNLRSSSVRATYSIALTLLLSSFDLRAAEKPAAAVFEGQLGTLIQKFCADCHGPDSPEGDLPLAHAKKFADLDTDAWSRVREKLQLGEMPPKGELQPTAEQRQQFIEWMTNELRRSGAVVEDKLSLPNYGNYTSHAALFDQKPTLPPATHSRLWRLRPGAYKVQGVQPFSLTPGQHFEDFSSMYSVDESAAEIILRNAQKLVESQTAVEIKGGEVLPASGSTEKRFLPLLNPENKPTDEEVQAAFVFQYQKVLDREPTEAELERVVALMEKVTRDVDRSHGVQAALTVPLLSPEAIYRFELGTGELDEHGRRRLSGREIAYALSYALSNEKPHRYNLYPIYKALEENQLASQEQVAAVVGELLTQPLDKTPRVLGFFDEYFDYKKAEGVFKEQPSFASNLVRDTEKLIRHIVEQDEDVLRELLTTQLTAIEREDLADIYGLSPDFKRKGGAFVELPPQMRAGILMQPSWLIAYSGNFDNDPVRRGKWIRERLLGGTVPDLPISVDAVVPEDEHKTLRQRYEVTEATYCWKCHQHMNPLGMPFEAFDHMGRFRTKELQKPVQTAGKITGSGDSKLDGEVSTPIQLMHRLANSERVQQVFVRYAFRYFLGRNETLRDAKTLQDANRAYEESGGSMKALVTYLLSSDSFLYRVNPEVDAFNISNPDP